MGTFVENVNTLATQLTDQNVININTIVAISGDIANVSANMTDIQAIVADLINIDAVSADLVNINIVATNIVSVNAVATNILSVNNVSTNMAALLSVSTQVVPNLAEILAADDNAVIATTKAAESQLSAWEAEARKMTADSYATEAEDVFVKTYTSNGDGTFTPTNTTEYSAFHWQQKAFTLVTAGIINDTTPALDKVYSSQKTQALHDAQAVAITNLSGASATFYNNTIQPIPEDPAAFIDLTWTNNQASTNTAILELGTNAFVLKQNGSYNFFNTLTFSRFSDGSPLNVTFELYDTVTTAVVSTYVQPIDMTAGTSMTIPMNALLNISGLGIGETKTIKVRMRASTANGTIELTSFSSILAMASVSSTATIDAIDAALGSIYEGLA